MFSSRAGDQVHHTVIHAAPSRSVSFCSASGPFEQQPSATNPLSAQTSTAVDCTEAPICASVSNWSPIFLSLSNLDETALRSNLLDSSQSHAPSSSNISAEHKSAANPCSRPVSGQAHVSESSSYAMCNSTASVSPTVISARKTAASSFAAVAGSGHFIRRTRSSYSRRRASLRSAAWPKPPPEVNCAPMQSVVLTKTQSLAIRVMPARVTQTSAPVSCSRAISRDVCVPTNSAISTKKRSHSTVSKELDETRARKSCEICFRSAASSKMSEEKKRGTLTISNCSKNYSSVFCSYCDDMYCVSCVTTNSDINAVRTDSSFICVQCVADCELKNSRPTVSKQTRVCRPSRDFSSVYLKSQAVSSSSVVAMSSALFRSSASTLPLRVISASWSILNEPPRPLVQDAALLARLAVLPASSLAFSSLLSGLSVSMLKKAHLKLPRYADRNPEQRAHARHQLAAALKEKGIFFDDDHSYPWDDCTEESHNIELLEPQMQKLDAQSTAVFVAAKTFSRAGEYGSVILQKDASQGWIVKATAPIAAHTLICHYSGQLDFLRHHIVDHRDDTLELVRSAHSSSSLVVSPSHRGNIARFLSGVNNFNDDRGKKQINVKAARFNIKGKAHMLLFASRKITDGEILCWDYNALIENGFDTSTFL